MDKFKLNKTNNNLVIFSDFDGTISIQDVNDEIFKKFGDEHSQEIEKKLKNNMISDRKAMEKQYERLDMSKNDFESFIYNNINIDPYFKEFYKMVKENDLDFSIISGGFIEYIIIALNKANISFDHPIYASTINFLKDNTKPNFLHDIKECKEIFGPCGNCKNKILKKMDNKKIIYIGDGLTDRCVADMVDLLLVKSNSILENYCINNNISYNPFNTFKDVKNIVNKYLKSNESGL
ncbi:MAG: MtnX-like HAD-IB family phosphatase [Bacillota bacterium]